MAAMLAMLLAGAAAAAPTLDLEAPRADGSGSAVGDSEPSPALMATADVTCCVGWPLPGNQTPAGCEAGGDANHDGGTYHFNAGRGTPAAVCGKLACECCRVGPHAKMCTPTPPPPPPKKEKLTFLSATLGSHMVLQRAPQQATVWGFTASGATVTTTMTPSACDGDGNCAGQTFTAVAGADGSWRQQLPATPASSTTSAGFSFTFTSSSPLKEKANMTDVLFGDVYLCGGQSNMEFSMAANSNRSALQAEANDYPNIRFFSVGHRTSSPTPLRDLQSVWEPWQVASNLTIVQNSAPGHTLFSTFSAVCWLFGKELSQQLSPSGAVPIGLVSNNWGGTKVEVWTPKKSYAQCNRTDGVEGAMYNAMILPYAEGPMALSGITWYQGEANTENATTAEQYGCLFPQMITAWRNAFKAPSMWFGFVQLSTWCATPPASLPQMRQAQMKALALDNVGYATNADRGLGCTIHPAAKQYCSVRLAHSALAMHYKKAIAWKSPSFKAAKSLATTTDGADGGRSTVSVSVQLNDVSPAGLRTADPYNYNPATYRYWNHTAVDCTGTFSSVNRTTKAKYNASMETQCAWASIEVGGSWHNATVAVAPGGQSLILSASVPAAAATDAPAVATATSYGWGPIPMMSIYSKDADLPVLGWNEPL